MADLNSVQIAFATLKNALEIANAIRQADLSMDHAETKLRFADLVGLLSEAKMQISDASELLREREAEIRRLQEFLAFKEQLERLNDAYFVVDAAGQAIDGPFCPRCVEVSQQGVHLIELRDRRERICPNCKTNFVTARVARPRNDPAATFSNQTQTEDDR